MSAQSPEPSCPLNTDEERLWRALQKMLVALPRALDEDLLCATGLSLTQYIVLMHLSEAEDDSMRMTELASAAALSASRITRVVENLRDQGLVTKRRHCTDARGYVTELTEAGRQRLLGAYPAHLASARRRVMDQVDPALVRRLADQVGSLAEPLLSPYERGAGRKESPANRDGISSQAALDVHAVAVTPPGRYRVGQHAAADDAEEPPGYPAAASSYREAVI